MSFLDTIFSGIQKASDFISNPQEEATKLGQTVFQNVIDSFKTEEDEDDPWEKARKFYGATWDTMDSVAQQKAVQNFGGVVTPTQTPPTQNTEYQLKDITEHNPTVWEKTKDILGDTFPGIREAYQKKEYEYWTNEAEQAKILPKIKEYATQELKIVQQKLAEKDSPYQDNMGIIGVGNMQGVLSSERKKYTPAEYNLLKDAEKILEQTIPKMEKRQSGEKAGFFESFGEYFSNGIANNFLGFDTAKKTFAILNAQDKELEDMDDYQKSIILESFGERGKTAGGKAGAFLPATAQFIMELIATGGIVSTAKKVTGDFAKKVLSDVMQKNIKTALDTKMGSILAKTAEIGIQTALMPMVIKNVNNGMNYGDAYISTMIEILSEKSGEYIQDFLGIPKMFSPNNRLVKAIQDPLTEAIEEIVGETAHAIHESRNPDITLAGFLENIALFSLVGALNTGVGRATDPTIQKKGADILKRIGASMAEATERMEKSPSLSLFGAGDAKNAYELGEAIIKGAIQKTGEKNQILPKNNQEENEQSTNTNENKKYSKELIEEAKKYKTAEEFITEKGNIHRPPEIESANTLDNLSNVYPDDIYSSNGLRYYGLQKNNADKESYEIIKQMRGKPNKEVTIYRAILPNEDAEIKPGDWVTFSKDYAKQHGEGPLNGQYKIISKNVKANELTSQGDDLNEWGYRPNNHKDYTKSQLKEIWEEAHKETPTVSLSLFGAGEGQMLYQFGKYFVDGIKERRTLAKTNNPNRFADMSKTIEKAEQTSIIRKIEEDENLKIREALDKKTKIFSSRWLKIRTKTDDKEIFLRELRNLPTLKRGENDDPYTAEQLKHGRIDARIEEAYEDGFKMEKEIKKLAKEKGISEKELEQEANQYIFILTKETHKEKKEFSEEAKKIAKMMIEYQKQTHEYLKNEGIISEFIKNQRNEVIPELGRTINPKTKKAEPTNMLDNIILSRAGAIAQVEQTKVRRELYTLWEENKENKMFETIFDEVKEANLDKYLEKLKKKNIALIYQYKKIKTDKKALYTIKGKTWELNTRKGKENEVETEKNRITYQLLDEIEQNTIQLKNEIYKLEREIAGEKKWKELDDIEKEKEENSEKTKEKYIDDTKNTADAKIEEKTKEKAQKTTELQKATNFLEQAKIQKMIQDIEEKAEEELKQRQEKIQAERKAMEEEIKKLTLFPEEFRIALVQYLWIKHAPERNKIHGDNSAGISTEEAYEEQKRIQKLPFFKDIKKWQKKILTWNEKTLNILLAGKVISQEEYVQVREIYKQHVPLMREWGQAQEDTSISTLKIEDKDPPIYRAKGSDLTVKDIIDNIEYNLLRAEKLVMQKKELGEIEEKRIEIEEEASGETLRKHEEMKEKALQKISEIQKEIEKVQKEKKNIPEKAETEAKKKIQETEETLKKDKEFFENIIKMREIKISEAKTEIRALKEERRMLKTLYNDPIRFLKVLINGELKILHVKEPNIARAINNTQISDIPTFLRSGTMLGNIGKKIFTTTSKTTNIIGRLATSYNPFFTLGNAPRDAQTFLINISSEDGIKFAKNTKNIPKNWKTILDYIKGNETEDTRLYKQFLMDGGTTGGFGMKMLNENRKNFSKLREKNITQWLDKIAKNWNEIAENSARFETYKIGIQQGKSRRESALSAKNITVNFNKKGEWGQYIDQLFLFANAGMQGTKNYYARSKSNGEWNRTWFIMVAGIMATEWIIRIWNDMIDDEWREKTNEWEKNGNFIIVTEPQNKNSFSAITIPKSLEINSIATIGSMIYDIATGKIHGGKANKEILGSIIQTANVLGQAGTTTQQFIPTAFRPIVQNLQNIKWNGQNVVPKGKGLKHEKWYEKTEESTIGRQIIALSKFLYEKTGWDTSPEQWKNVIEQYGSGLGREIWRITTINKNTKAEDMPAINRFYTHREGKELQDTIANNQEQQKQGFWESIFPTWEIFRTKDNAILVRVIDGDTIEVLLNNEIEKVRMLGIDTPESTTKLNFFGIEASQKLKKELHAGEEILLYTENGEDDLDKFGRMLRYVEVQGGENINELMLREGYARVSPYSMDNKKLLKIAQEAQEAKLGLWTQESKNISIKEIDEKLAQIETQKWEEKLNTPEGNKRRAQRELKQKITDTTSAINKLEAKNRNEAEETLYQIQKEQLEEMLKIDGESVEDLVGYQKLLERTKKEQMRIEDRAKIEEYAKKEEKTIAQLFTEKYSNSDKKEIFVKIRINAKLGKITNEDIDEMAKIGFIQKPENAKAFITMTKKEIENLFGKEMKDLVTQEEKRAGI